MNKSGSESSFPAPDHQTQLTLPTNDIKSMLSWRLISEGVSHYFDIVLMRLSLEIRNLMCASAIQVYGEGEGCSDANAI